MEIQFKTKNIKQLEACKKWLDNDIEQILFGGGKGGGKSYLGCALIFGDALIYPNTHYFIARSELTDIRKFTIPTIHEVFSDWKLKVDDYMTFNGQDNCYTLNNGSKVFLLACKHMPSDPLFERFGSMQMTRGWIEEGGEVPERAKANLWLSIGRWKNDIYNLKKKLLITANPKKNWMKTEFIDPFYSQTLHKTKVFIQSLVTDNPYMSFDYIKTLSEEKDEVTKQRLFLGEWDYAEDKNSLLKEDSLSDLFTNTVIKTNYKYITCDVARYGRDSTTIALWDSLELINLNIYENLSIPTIINKIKELARNNQVAFSNIIVDEDGVGGGVVDGLVGIKGFIANSSPLPTKTAILNKFSLTKENTRTGYKNLNVQCAYKLADLINNRKIAIKLNDENIKEKIKDEITACLKFKESEKEGFLNVVSKDEVKAMIGRSPDLYDVLKFRMWFELKKDAHENSEEREYVIIRQKEILDKNKNNFTSTFNQ